MLVSIDENYNIAVAVAVAVSGSARGEVEVAFKLLLTQLQRTTTPAGVIDPLLQLQEPRAFVLTLKIWVRVTKRTTSAQNLEGGQEDSRVLKNVLSR